MARSLVRWMVKHPWHGRNLVQDRACQKICCLTAFLARVGELRLPTVDVHQSVDKVVQNSARPRQYWIAALCPRIRQAGPHETSTTGHFRQAKRKKRSTQVSVGGPFCVAFTAPRSLRTRRRVRSRLLRRWNHHNVAGCFGLNGDCSGVSGYHHRFHLTHHPPTGHAAAGAAVAEYAGLTGDLVFTL